MLRLRLLIRKSLTSLSSRKRGNGRCMTNPFSFNGLIFLVRQLFFIFQRYNWCDLFVKFEILNMIWNNTIWNCFEFRIFWDHHLQRTVDFDLKLTLRFWIEFFDVGIGTHSFRKFHIGICNASRWISHD